MRLVLTLLLLFLSGIVEGVLTELSPNNFTVSDFQIASDLNGNLAAAWTVNNGSHLVLQGAYKPVGLPWQTVGGPGERAGSPRLQQNILSPIGYPVVAFQVVLDDFGVATYVWRVFNGTHMVVQASTKTQLGPFNIQGDPTAQSNVLSPLGYNVSIPPSVAAGGNVTVITWQLFNNFRTVAQVAFRQGIGPFVTPGSPIFQPNVISPLGFDLSIPPISAVDIFGNAAVTWVIYNGDNTVVQAVSKPAAALTFGIAGDPRIQANIISTLGSNVVTPPQINSTGGITFIAWELQRTNGTVLQAFTFP